MLSVVIPTYNRCNILQKTLRALCQQEGATNFEIIVVDDGSTDATSQVVAALAALAPVRVRCIAQPNSGAAAARNRGLQEANGEIVLFLDDDVIGSSALIAEHLRSHMLNPAPLIAILGFEGFSPDLPATPLNLRHTVFNWDSLQDGQELDWRHFLTGNVSVKRSFLLNHQLFFDESLPCFQDIELGYRCWKQGMRIIYNARAPGQHYHDLSFEGALRLNQKYGEALAIVHHKHPELRHELGDYMVFSWGNGPRRVLHDLLRPAVLNRFTVGGLLFLARRWQASGRETPYAVSRRIGNYYERKGYQHKTRDLERQRS